MGTAKPFAGRVRLGAETRLRWLTSGVAGLDRIELAEQRVALEVAWAPVAALFLSARVPLVRRDLIFPDLSRASLFHVGDAELSAKGFVFQDRAFDPEHLMALEAGLELPTAPRLTRPDGEPLGFEAQPGTGSFDPSAGVSYAWFARPLSVYTSVRGLFPTAGRFGARSGAALLASVVAQVDASVLAARAGLDFRAEAPFEENGLEDPHSGGVGLFITPEVLLGGWSDLMVRIAVSVPAVLDLRGTQTEGPTIRFGVVLDV